MLNVMITVDLEVYPLHPDWQRDNLERDLRRDVYGETASGPFGLIYQLEMLARHGLKAVFFVEGLFPLAVGISPLREIVGQIRAAGHEVQLHLHPEWLAWTKEPPVQAEGRERIDQFSFEEQKHLIAVALGNLRLAGAQEVSAFRAGDFAANEATLRAVRENGLRYDSSCDVCYPWSFPDMPELQKATQPVRESGVVEVPVSYWSTPPIGRRHAQLSAASWGELGGALWHAERNDWRTFVIVSHVFELLKKRRQYIQRPRPDTVVVSRFEDLCRFLHRHAGDFRTVGFGDLEFGGASLSAAKPALVSPLHRTASRLIQQAYRRLTVLAPVVLTTSYLAA